MAFKLDEHTETLRETLLILNCGEVVYFDKGKDEFKTHYLTGQDIEECKEKILEFLEDEKILSKLSLEDVLKLSGYTWRDKNMIWTYPPQKVMDMLVQYFARNFEKGFNNVVWQNNNQLFSFIETPVGQQVYHQIYANMNKEKNELEQRVTLLEQAILKNIDTKQTLVQDNESEYILQDNTLAK